MDYSSNMQDVYKNIEKYNPGKKSKVLIVFDNMTADMINNKKLNPIVTELLLEARKSIFQLSLSLNHTFKCQKMLD